MKTSLKLSKLLAEHGCELESEIVYVDTRKSWKAYNCPFALPDEDFRFVPFWNLDESHPECELVENKAPFPNQGYNESKPIPAYDIMNDLCIKYAKEVFGDEYSNAVNLLWKADTSFRSYAQGGFSGNIYDLRNKAGKMFAEYVSTSIFKLLQQGKQDEAEDYLWRHCLFNPLNK